MQLTVSRGPNTPHSSTYAHGSQMAGLQVLPIIGHTHVLAGHIDCPAQFEQCLPVLLQGMISRRAQFG